MDAKRRCGQMTKLNIWFQLLTYLLFLPSLCHIHKGFVALMQSCRCKNTRWVRSANCKCHHQTFNFQQTFLFSLLSNNIHICFLPELTRKKRQLQKPPQPQVSITLLKRQYSYPCECYLMADRARWLFWERRLLARGLYMKHKGKKLNKKHDLQCYFILNVEKGFMASSVFFSGGNGFKWLFEW